MKKLIALTLALLLAGLLLPTTALAEENNNVAKIGDTKYASLKDALGVASSGDTITLLKDCELSNGYDSIRALKSITLDLNGCTMTLKKSDFRAELCNLYNTERRNYRRHKSRI